MIADLILQISIGLELLIAGLGVLIATQKKKTYGWGIALTFFLYAFYDCEKINPAFSGSVLSYVFFAATLSALWAAWGIYKEK